MQKKKKKTQKPDSNGDEHPAKGVTIGTKPIFKFPKKPSVPLTQRILHFLANPPQKKTSIVHHRRLFMFKLTTSQKIHMAIHKLYLKIHRDSNDEKIRKIRDTQTDSVIKTEKFDPCLNGWYAMDGWQFQHFYIVAYKERACSGRKFKITGFELNSIQPRCKKCQKIVNQLGWSWFN